MSPWFRAALKVVITAATMCSGVVIAKFDVLRIDEGQGRRDIRQDRQDLEQTANKVSVG